MSSGQQIEQLIDACLSAFEAGNVSRLIYEEAIQAIVYLYFE